MGHIIEPGFSQLVKNMKERVVTLTPDQETRRKAFFKKAKELMFANIRRDQNSELAFASILNKKHTNRFVIFLSYNLQRNCAPIEVTYVNGDTTAHTSISVDNFMELTPVDIEKAVISLSHIENQYEELQKAQEAFKKEKQNIRKSIKKIFS